MALLDTRGEEIMPHQYAVANVPVRVLLRQFFLIYLFAAVVLTIAIFASIRLDESDRIDRTMVREAARVEIAKNLVTRDFLSVTSDLRLLAATPTLRRYLNNDASSPQELADLFLALATSAGRYDQVRYLDTAGREVIRVNFNSGNPIIVPHGDLQDKSGRYFFRDSIKLNPGEVYISPMDLNIEHDQLEVPHKPMIRFATRCSTAPDASAASSCSTISATSCCGISARPCAAAIRATACCSIAMATG